MGNGRLQCVGTSLRLKQRFGAGYRVTVGTTEEKVETVQQFFSDNLACATMQGVAIGGYMSYNVPRENTKELIPFFKKMERETKALSILVCKYIYK